MRSARARDSIALCWLLLAACCVPSVDSPEEDLLRAFAQDRNSAQAALSLARSAFDAYALRRERVSAPKDLPPLLRERSGVFVSAILGDAPRCCMGSLYPTRETLAEEITAAAVAAAGLDVRRGPVQPDEVKRLRLVVSIVASPESISDPTGLDPVTEGLAVRSRARTGVVLPGETRHLERMIQWARIRAAASPDEPVDYFRIRAFRIAERPPGVISSKFNLRRTAAIGSSAYLDED